MPELWVIDAVKLSLRVFRVPTPEGYGETWEATSDQRVLPVFAPEVFALRIADLGIED